MLLEPLGITTLIVGFNGGVLATPDLTIIKESLLSPETARRAVEMLEERDVQVWVFSRQKWVKQKSKRASLRSSPIIRLRHTVPRCGVCVSLDRGWLCCVPWSAWFRLANRTLIRLETRSNRSLLRTRVASGGELTEELRSLLPGNRA